MKNKKTAIAPEEATTVKTKTMSFQKAVHTFLLLYLRNKRSKLAGVVRQIFVAGNLEHFLKHFHKK